MMSTKGALYGKMRTNKLKLKHEQEYIRNYIYMQIDRLEESNYTTVRIRTPRAGE